MFRRDERHVDRSQEDVFSGIEKKKIHRLGQFSEAFVKEESQGDSSCEEVARKGKRLH